jgi:hypothetical protein
MGGVSSSSLPSAFDDFVDRLRKKIGRADAERPSEGHDFRGLMSDEAEGIPEGWWERAFERLQSQGHLDPASSGMSMGPSPHGRLSDAGHTYLESQPD